MRIICTIYLLREWEEPRSESFTWDFREKRVYSLSFSRFVIPSMFFERENFSKYENSNFSLVFSTQNTLSTNFKTFSFIELHETHSFTLDCKNTFSPELHERHLIIDWNMFLHDPTWKCHHMKPFSFFLGSGQNFTAHTWFWLFNLFFKFVSLSICLNLIHMRRDNQVENISKFTFKLLESFQHF